MAGSLGGYPEEDLGQVDHGGMACREEKERGRKVGDLKLRILLYIDSLT